MFFGSMGFPGDENYNAHDQFANYLGTMGAGILAANNGQPGALGRGMMAGNQMWTQAQNNALAAQLNKLKLKEAQINIDTKERQQEMQRKFIESLNRGGQESNQSAVQSGYSPTPLDMLDISEGNYGDVYRRKSENMSANWARENLGEYFPGIDGMTDAGANAVFKEYVKGQTDLTANQRDFRAAQADPEYMQFLQMTGSDNTPASIQEFRLLKKLGPEDRQLWFANKRATQYRDIGGSIEQMPLVPGQPPVHVMPTTVPPEKTPEHAAKVEAAKTAAKIEAGGEITPAEKKENAQSRVSGNLSEVANLYRKLNKMGGAVNVHNSSVENILTSIAASDMGQAIQRYAGTDTQSIRNQINQIRPTIINDIRQAAEMGAKGMDSEKELEFFLQAATDPKRDIQSNMAALKVLDNAYGLGLGEFDVETSVIDALQDEYKKSSTGPRFIGYD